MQVTLKVMSRLSIWPSNKEVKVVEARKKNESLKGRVESHFENPAILRAGLGL